MSTKRPPNELESKLHQAALSAPKQELSVKQAEAIIPDGSARQNAINFLLAVGLFKPLVDAKGNLSFRAVTKNELDATKGLSGEESLVLGYIKASRHEGIWVKHLKAKTNLHQTIIDRCLKTLTQKQLIKRVSSVQHSTRKIYILQGLEPSIELTGGPWYTDKELDTEFIQHLSDACLKFIHDISFPKRHTQSAEGALYAISNLPEYPTAQHIRHSLKKARLTETDLSVEHVEMLLNVLVLDGKIERLPSFGASMWDSHAIDDGESHSESDRPSKKKRKRLSSDDEAASSKRKRKKKVTSEDDSSSDDARRKKTKKKRASVNSDLDSDSESTALKKKRKKKKKKSRYASDEDSSSSDEETSKKKHKKKRHRKNSDDESSDESDGPSRHSKSSKSLKRSPSPFRSLDNLDNGSAYVYRAIKQENISLGWLESPCSQCPSFEFCKDGGPVNPRECVYYSDWLVGGTVASTELDM